MGSEVATAELPTTAGKVPFWRLVTSQTLITDEVLQFPYPGSGTSQKPYSVDWIPSDSRNPQSFSQPRKWAITALASVATLSISFSSAVMSGGVKQIIVDFDSNSEVATLSVSLYVLGFGLGPMTWAPLSELYGRQIIFFFSMFWSTLFGAASLASKNIQTLLVLRFLSGVGGGSALVNSAGILSDMFNARERGLALALWSVAPFWGPVLGPLAGGFVGQYGGWRWVDGTTVIFTGAIWIFGTIFMPETYTPALLERRARKLSKMTGRVYKSKLEIERGEKSAKTVFGVAMKRPWVLLVREPIVLSLSIYAAIVYGTLYLTFTAFPIVFGQQRHWSQGVSGLSFLGVAVGQLLGSCFTIYLDRRYRRATERTAGFAPPEARLPPALIGCICIPVGLFWFAWTNNPSIHWIVCIIGSAPFGFGQVILFQSLINYLVDAYTIYAASVMAASAILRATFGAAFPLFTTYMYDNLGVNWASSIPAFLSLACVPFPFLFYQYGLRIREHCKYAAESKRLMDLLHSQSRLELVSMGDEK